MVSEKKKISREAELRFASEFVKKGYDVFFPMSEFGAIDLAVHKDGCFKRVQVKATKPTNGGLTVKLRSTNNWQDKRYTTNDVDGIAAYDYMSCRGYLFDLKKFEGQSQVVLRTNPTKNNQKKLVNSASKFLWFK